MTINQVNYSGGVVLALLLSPEPIVRLYSKRQITVDSFKWWMSLAPVLGISSTTLLGIASAQLIDNVILISLSYNVGLLCSATFTDHVGFLGSPKYSIVPLRLVALLRPLPWYYYDHKIFTDHVGVPGATEVLHLNSIGPLKLVAMRLIL